MRMPRQDAKRIIEKIEQYASDPQSLTNNVKALQSRDGIRLRVGNWRVIMEDGVVLDVLAIGKRSEIYR
jgi:mRNA interferase RelE/StbE